MLFLRWFAICLLCLPLTLFAADKPTTKDDLDHAKEVIQLKLDAAQSGLQKDNQAFANRLESQDKLIDLIKSRVDWFVGGLSIIVIFLGVASYVSATNKAKQEAQTAVADWFKDYQGRLDAALSDFENKSQRLLVEMAQHANLTKQNMTHIEGSVQEAAEKKIATMKIGTSSSDTLSDTKTDAASALQQVAQSLEQKPESEYGFKEWNTRAFAAYENRDLEGAARYWGRAAESTTATAIQTAQSLYNSGIALGEQNRHEEVLATYNDIILRFDSTSDPILRELVARSMLNKGIAQSKLQQTEESIVSFDDVISRFGDTMEVAFQELVAKAMLNKGNAQSLSPTYEQAIDTYDTLIERFANATDTVLREQVADALNGKGFALLRLAKQNWNEEASRKQRLQQAQQLFAEALAHISNKSMVLGNQAYCAHLLGQTEQARELLRQALIEGGKEIYEAALDELATHPAPADEGSRALLEEVWTEVQQSQ